MNFNFENSRYTVKLVLLKNPASVARRYKKFFGDNSEELLGCFIQKSSTKYGIGEICLSIEKLDLYTIIHEVSHACVYFDKKINMVNKLEGFHEEIFATNMEGMVQKIIKYLRYLGIRFKS